MNDCLRGHSCSCEQERVVADFVATPNGARDETKRFEALMTGPKAISGLEAQEASIAPLAERTDIEFLVLSTQLSN
jgi:hypothetical protein